MPARALTVLLMVLALAAIGCDPTAYAPYRIELVDGQGGNPVAGASGSLTVTVLQSGAEPIMATSTITDGVFSLDVPIGDYELATVLSAEILRAGGPPLIGATLPFRPIRYGFIRMVMGEPGSCVALADPHLGGARRSPGLALVEVNLFSIGGLVGGASPVSRVEVFSPVQLTADLITIELDTLTEGFGLTRTVPIPGTTEVFALDASHAIRYEGGGTDVTSPRERAVALYAGAGVGSALAAVPGRGVAIVGGRNGGSVVSEGRVVPVAAGEAQRIALAHAREGASAIAMADGLLIAGGQADGAPLFEWVSLTGTPSSTFGDGLPARAEGALVLSSDGRTALYYLGRQSDGSLPATSFVITGCPTSCSAVPGPDTLSPRTNPAIARREVATAVLGGARADLTPSSAVEEVRFVSVGMVTLAALGDLNFARRDLAAVTLGGGTVLVAGGTGSEGDLDSMELCFPEALDTLTVPSL